VQQVSRYLACSADVSLTITAQISRMCSTVILGCSTLNWCNASKASTAAQELLADHRHHLRDWPCWLFVCTGLEEQVGKASMRQWRQQHARAVQEQQLILADCMPCLPKARSRSKNRKIRCKLFQAYEYVY